MQEDPEYELKMRIARLPEMLLGSSTNTSSVVSFSHFATLDRNHLECRLVVESCADEPETVSEDENLASYADGSFNSIFDLQTFAYNN